jgi:predicted TIM-barrel fold metal-dependent hydrolase
MLGDMLIIDGVIHGIDNSPAVADANRYIRSIIDLSYGLQEAWIPPEYVMDRAQYFTKHSADDMLSAVFRESQVDIACYHALPMKGIAKDYCPIDVGLEMRERYPHRMLIYAPIHPLDGVESAIEELERHVAERQINGIKLYPADLVDGKLRSYVLSDEKLLYPLFQRCLELGVKVVAVHKAVPLGIAPMDPFRVGDVDYAARDFPDLAFEVVHAGIAFLDESAWHMSRYDNVYVNLEVTADYAVRQQDKFARIVGEFLLAGGEDRLIWASGCLIVHPRPVLEAFANFKMPQYLVDGGYPELTPERKAKIFGLNFARLHGLDVADLKRRIAADDIEAAKAQGLRKPWSAASS